MIVLGIETTCDETAAAVVRLRPGGRPEILSNCIYSQIEEHAAYGGVVPEIAARAHVVALDGQIAAALKQAGLRLDQVDGIAAAAGPGLIGGVIVGLTAGKTLALAAQKPFIAVNHLEAHALSPRMVEDLAFPYLLLLASGGHSQLLAVRSVNDYWRLGGTIDDALGEAFDKTAKMLGLPYPGGPAVEREAAMGNPERFAFPRPMLGRKNADFSLSGLKTAVRIEAEKTAPLRRMDIADLCASFQAAILDVVVDRTRVALSMFRTGIGQPNALVVAGGVAANKSIRRSLERLANESGLPLVAPPPALCTDNGAMIAWAGLERLRLGQTDRLDTAPRPRWPLSSKRGLQSFAQEGGL
jgi:N6-L-threonylcarbamoyladenine synthase